MNADPPKSTPIVIDTHNGDQVVLNPDGSASVTSSGGVEVVLEPNGQPKMAGLTAFGIDDLAYVERFESLNEGGVTKHLIYFRGGSTAVVSYNNRVLESYSGNQLGLNIRSQETKAYLKPGEGTLKN